MAWQRFLLLSGLVLFWAIASALRAAPSAVEPLAGDAYVAADDADAWDGVATTHQRGPGYTARKILDLSRVPQEFWPQVTEIRLSAMFCVRDYSWHDGPRANGLDETLEITVNGRVHSIADSAGLPAYSEKKSMVQSVAWHDFVLPKEEFVRGVNEITFRMTAPKDKKPDDYLYLAIDTNVPSGNSWVKLGAGQAWRQDRLNAVGVRGEYMVRLYLLCGSPRFRATWSAADGRTDDAARIIDYAGCDGGEPTIEWNPSRLDAQAPLVLTVNFDAGKTTRLSWLNAEGETEGRPVVLHGPVATVRLDPPLAFIPAGVQFPPGAPLRSVTLEASRSLRSPPRQVDMAPRIVEPAGKPAARKPACRIDAASIVLENATLRGVFRRHGPRLELASLYNEITATEMARHAADCALGLVEVGGKRYALSRDFEFRGVKGLTGRAGFEATLFCPAVALEAALQVSIDEALHWNLRITNRAARSVDFKVAFPHLAGLATSAQPADDYYFFPLGAVISDTPALIRKGYGDHQALYQLMDVFSPARGGGLATWCGDDDGRYKVLALRKYVPGMKQTLEDRPTTPTADEFKWTNSFDAVPGIGLTWEYLRRSRAPGDSFAVKEVVMGAHAGDWHAAMRAYAERCHRLWKYRPYPSRLTGVVNMVGDGWGQSPLFRDGKYRDDFLKPQNDCLELMSWWEWSTLGPRGLPIDRLNSVEDPARVKSWLSYIVKDPVTGVPMFSNNPGDYDGYNQRFGGLPALRAAIERYQKAGHMVTLYTDPFRVDYASQCGQKWGKLWGVVQPDGKYMVAYDAWRMCHDVADYRRWVAQAMARAIRETGADGIRLDEYGHAGSACFSKLHAHTYAEWGCTEWQRGVAEAVRLVRRAMDDVKPGSVLTTEHPGYDFLMPNLEGCITYDLSVLASPLRPLPCNLQRFYFPECKPFELARRGVDHNHRQRFWNAVGSFGTVYPPAMDAILRENAAVLASRDCEPLLPTLVRYVYANRFRNGQRTITMLYNATGRSLTAAFLEVPRAAGRHTVDLLGCREIVCRAHGLSGVAEGFLGRGNVACLASLPERLAVRPSADAIEVRVNCAEPGGELRICDRSGKILWSGFSGKELVRRIQRRDLTAGAAPACVKLLAGGQLVDMVPVP